MPDPYEEDTIRGIDEVVDPLQVAREIDAVERLIRKAQQGTTDGDLSDPDLLRGVLEDAAGRFDGMRLQGWELTPIIERARQAAILIGVVIAAWIGIAVLNDPHATQEFARQIVERIQTGTSPPGPAGGHSGPGAGGAGTPVEPTAAMAGLGAATAALVTGSAAGSTGPVPTVGEPTATTIVVALPLVTPGSDTPGGGTPPSTDPPIIDIPPIDVPPIIDEPTPSTTTTTLPDGRGGEGGHGTDDCSGCTTSSTDTTTPTTTEPPIDVPVDLPVDVTLP